ncbi:hypothetical protein B5X24_HaOG209186 [Helicoverpa armigera]|nr:hypothetical protein B5X24_HaOG209186 [Helicoverpa armigera]
MNEIVLNVDVNDYASRQIEVDVPSDLQFGKFEILRETEQDSLYYELVLKDFNTLHQAYLLHVEPTASCKATQFHVSAELHVPWAPNHENYHYFTQTKQSPMKLRLYRSNPNITEGLDATEDVKVTLLLDPQCTYSISISTSWYLRLAQIARNYSPVIVPYATAIVLLAARSNILHLQDHGSCVSLHTTFMSEGVKPYYALVFGRLGATVFLSIPILSFMFENASWQNQELRYFVKSLLVLPAYMTALGILNIMAAAVLAVMVFSSQIAHRLLFRIMWRGGSGLAEKVASGLQKVPMVVSAGLLCAAPLSCGAASLVAGAAFYAFMIPPVVSLMSHGIYSAHVLPESSAFKQKNESLSKMYEEYLEDYVYKIMAKIGSRICRMFKKNKTKEAETSLVKADEHSSQNGIENKGKVTSEKGCQANAKKNENNLDVDEDLSSLNFHMMMFSLWLAVTMVNVPALLTWARNFSYSVVLKPDTSYHTGLVMSACSTCIWQMNGPRRNLRHYESVAALLFTMAVFILALGPLSLTIVNYGVTFMFAVITVQQVCDKEEIIPSKQNTHKPNIDDESESSNIEHEFSDKSQEEKCDENSEKTSESGMEDALEDCDMCNESQIFNVIKRLRDKVNYNENL